MGFPDADIAVSVTVIAEVPDGVTRGAGTTAAAPELPPPQPASGTSMQSAITVRTVVCVQQLVIVGPGDALRMLAKKSKTSAVSATPKTRRPVLGVNRKGICGGILAAPLVVTITANGTAAPLVTERVEGTWHAAPTGAPLQAREMLPV